MKEKIISLSGLLIVLALTGGVYLNSLNNSFQYDDEHHILKNPYIREPSNIPLFFVTPGVFSVEPRYRMYRPLLLSSYLLNYQLDGYNPYGWHLVNLFLHLFNVFLVYCISSFFLRDRFKREFGGISEYKIIALLISTLYGVHPINSEAVNYISSRSNVMATTFFLLAFYLFIKSGISSQKSEVRDQRDEITIHRSQITIYLFTYLLSLVSYALGLLTKEIVFTLPVILLLYEVLFNNNQRSAVSGQQSGVNWWKNFLHSQLPTLYSLLFRHLPFWAISILYLYLRKIVMGATDLAGSIPPELRLGVTLQAESLSRTFRYQLTQIKVILNYLKLYLFPAGLNVDHAYPLVKSPLEISFLLSFALLLILLILTFYLYRKERLITLFSLWFFITLMPTSIISLNIVMAENRMYLSGVGLAIIGGVIMWRLGEIMVDFAGKKGIIVSITLIIILTGIFSLGTIKRNRVWGTGYSLWKDAVTKSPHSTRAHQNLGKAYSDMGELDKAIEEFKVAISIYPKIPHAYDLLGAVYVKKGLYSKGFEALNKALELNPYSATARSNLGTLYSGLWDFDKAIEEYKKAIRLRPMYSEAHNGLGNMYYLKGDVEKAWKEFNIALDIDPNNIDARINIEDMIKRYGYRLID